VLASCIVCVCVLSASVCCVTLVISRPAGGGLWDSSRPRPVVSMGRNMQATAASRLQPQYVANTSRMDVLISICPHTHRDRERQRETERDRERQRNRETGRQRNRQRNRQTDRDRQKGRERERERQTERDRQTEKQTDRHTLYINMALYPFIDNILPNITQYYH